jgi:hypothetical protein
MCHTQAHDLDEAAAGRAVQVGAVPWPADGVPVQHLAGARPTGRGGVGRFPPRGSGRCARTRRRRRS